MHDVPAQSKLLPENAYRRLEPGEIYQPIVAAGDLRAEVTSWSVMMAVLLVGVFSAAAVYIALRAGSGIETAIPIAVLAVFFGKLRKIRSTILENVIVQSIGQASGVVAAGAAFTIPALYLNGLQNEVHGWHIFLACLIGGSLGVVLIIPLRKYFVAERHGELPFPEATATTEILVAGENTGKGAGRVLIAAFGLGAAYDFIVEALHGWNPALTTQKLLGVAGEKLYSFRIEGKMNAIAALFGLGYIIGPKYAALIASGSVLSSFIMVPLIYVVGSQVTDFHFLGASIDVSQMSAGAIFGQFVRPIGIGAIAVSGLIGIARMGRIIVRSVGLGFKGLGKGSAEMEKEERTKVDLRPKTVMLIQMASTLAMGLLFFVVTSGLGSFSAGSSLLFAVVGMVVGFALSFLFTPVAAEAIAIVGVNPVSGMTMITLILASLVMVGVGLVGGAGIFVAVIIGCAVCTALSTSGALIGDFKIGYWIGATPRRQQAWKFLGVAVAALVVAIVVPVMDNAYHFMVPIDPNSIPIFDPANPIAGMMANTEALPAPQASMLAEIVRALMGGGSQPYLLYGLGAFIALMLVMAGVPPLPFALGMYLPISINVAVLFGGLVSWAVGKSSKDKEVAKARAGQGTLIASGLMAGAAIFGIVAALFRIDWNEFFGSNVGFLRYPIRYLSIGVDYVVGTTAAGATYLSHAPHPEPTFYESTGGQVVGLIMFVGLAVAVFLLARWGANMERKELQGK
ncbi:MAG: oligopeptide transporter, OPT family [Deltaproteobacteria bacterium RIFOXYA12_FULL_58_15]|nr:MAG: oligopeptide transporter, OPT family [Deltaproteobacteria bacterium RIFOXYA12_FULL_58_15]OGR14030.1 MAG: oligopeptide transporter, OPT family [Deltaproteobacteria bacterium RIFOXYB12_FULL_58_9]